MSGSAPGIQWFIARDGKQHGPVTDVELKKIIELAHLKPTDLVWRQGFTDWRTASSVFPELAEPEPAAPSPVQPAQPASPAPAKVASPSPQLAPLKGSASQQYAQQTSGSAARESWRPREETARPDQLATRPLGTPTVRTAGPLPAAGPGPGGPIPGGPTPAGTPAPRPTTDSRRPAELSSQPPPEAPTSSRGRRLALVATGLLAMTGLGAWLSSEYKDEVFSYMQADDSVAESGPATANVMPPSAPTTTAAVQTVVTTPHTPEDIDRKLQSRNMWVTVKQEFPDWYQARVTEVARLSAEKKDQSEITRYLVGELVALRRENAKYALAASTTRHKELAAAFLANLNQLSQESGDDCYEFISKGESSPTIISRMDDPAKSAEIEAQVVAVVGAIVEGKKQPAEHSAPVKTDYDVLPESWAASAGRRPTCSSSPIRRRSPRPRAPASAACSRTGSRRTSPFRIRARRSASCSRP
jgi:hypothetical protein